jgi:hypothetical protein
MRMYVFANRYISGVHVGIQSAHAIARCSLQMRRGIHAYERWVTEHETICVLNGGDHQDLERIKDRLIQNHSLWEEEVGSFREVGMNNSYTAIAFIADERLCECMSEIKLYKKNKGTPLDTFNSKASFEQYMLKKYDGDLIDALDDESDGEWEGIFALAKMVMSYSSHRG